MHQQNVKIMTQFIYIFWMSYHFKWIVHFEITFWYVLAYLKGIQDICVFVSTVVALALCGGPHIPALYDWQTRTV